MIEEFIALFEPLISDVILRILALECGMWRYAERCELAAVVFAVLLTEDAQHILCTCDYRRLAGVL